jgi:putative transposase
MLTAAGSVSVTMPFYSLAEARIVIESWRRFYNSLRPHGSLGYKPPAPEFFIPAQTTRSDAPP